MANVLAALVPVFLVIALGAALKRFLLPEDGHWVALERLTYFVLFPALIVVSIARTDFGNVDVARVAAALIGSLVLMSAFVMLARVPLSRTLGLDGPAFTSVFQGATRWNTYIGLAVSGGLAGAAGLAVAAVVIAFVIPLTNAVSVMVLARYGAGGGKPQHMLVHLARNPFIWSCAAGGLIQLLDLPVPPVLMTFADILGRASLALGLLVVGAGLRLGEIHRPRAATLFTAVLKLVVLPILAVSLGLLCGLSGVDLLIVAVASAVPSAPNGYVLARQMGGDAPLLAEMLTMQTVLAAASLPVVIAAVGYL